MKTVAEILRWKAPDWTNIDLKIKKKKNLQLDAQVIYHPFIATPSQLESGIKAFEHNGSIYKIDDEISKQKQLQSCYSLIRYALCGDELKLFSSLDYNAVLPDLNIPLYQLERCLNGKHVYHKIIVDQFREIRDSQTDDTTFYLEPYGNIMDKVDLVLTYKKIIFIAKHTDNTERILGHWCYGVIFINDGVVTCHYGDSLKYNVPATILDFVQALKVHFKDRSKLQIENKLPVGIQSDCTFVDGMTASTLNACSLFALDGLRNYLGIKSSVLQWHEVYIERNNLLRKMVKKFANTRSPGKKQKYQKCTLDLTQILKEAVENKTLDSSKRKWQKLYYNPFYHDKLNTILIGQTESEKLSRLRKYARTILKN